jgi:hypothetical protein
LALNYRQRLFVEAYLGDANGNATKAARAAGYTHPHEQGRRLVRNCTIKAQVARRVAEAAMPANEVLARMSELAALDPGEMMDDAGWIDLGKARRRRLTRHIHKVNRKDGEITSVEFKDSLRALIKLGEYHGLWDRPNDARGGLAGILAALVADRGDPDRPADVPR